MIENKSIPLATVEDKKVSEIMRSQFDRMRYQECTCQMNNFIEEQLEELDYERDEEFELLQHQKIKKSSLILKILTLEAVIY